MKDEKKTRARLIGELAELRRSVGKSEASGTGGNREENKPLLNWEQHRELFETTEQGVVYQNERGEIILANPASERALGLTLDQMQGRTSVDPRRKAVHEDGSDFPGETHPAMIALKTGRTVNNVTMGIFNPETQAYRWILINAVPQSRIGEDKPYQVYSTFDDITVRLQTETALKEALDRLESRVNDRTADLEREIIERKRAEEQLRENTDRLRLSIDRMPLAYIVWDKQWRVLEWNEAAETIFGYSKEEILGKNGMEYVIPEEARLHVAALTKHFENGESVHFSAKDNNIRKDGTLISCQWNNTPLFDESGEFFALLSMAEDVTERFRAEEVQQLYKDQLETSNRHLAAANDSLQEMVYIASHDLQSPLISIVGFSGVVLEEYRDSLDDEGVRHLERVRESAIRMQKFVDSLLDLSRLNTVTNPSETFAPQEMLDDVVGDLSLMLESEGVEIEIADMPPMHGDRQRLDGVFRRMITNAVHYRAKHITVGYEKNAYFVRDDGIGIPESQLEKIFRPGERLKRITVEGAGMGLTFCRKVIAQHGGHMWAESDGESKGSTFYVRIM